MRASSGSFEGVIIEGMKAVLSIVVLCACACGASAPTQQNANAVEYSSPIVLFVSPDSQEISALKKRLGDDAFYVTADDAMWYRSGAYELLDSLNIPHAEVRRGAARFRIDGRTRIVSWRTVAMTWFLVVYDGKTQPRITADIDIRSVLRPQGRP